MFAIGDQYVSKLDEFIAARGNIATKARVPAVFGAAWNAARGRAAVRTKNDGYVPDALEVPEVKMPV